jgi:hemerythrin-like domain-containing protein
MESAKGPIKRHEALKPLSRQHHHGLLLCWKISQGLSKKTELSRIGAYVSYFFSQHIRPHFREEEEKIFPLLGEKHPSVLKALSDHAGLHRLFVKPDKSASDFRELTTLLEQHIRFEERVLFKEIQDHAPEGLALLNTIENESCATDDEWPDEFWSNMKK